MQNKLISISYHLKKTFTDKTWMYLVSLIAIIINIFFSIKIFSVGLAIWFLLLAFDLLFKTTEASNLMQSKPTANVAKLIYFLIGISSLLIFLIVFNHFIFAMLALVLHFVLYSFISVAVCRNIEVFLQNVR